MKSVPLASLPGECSRNELFTLNHKYVGSWIPLQSSVNGGISNRSLKALGIEIMNNGALEAVTGRDRGVTLPSQFSFHAYACI